jgi:hypothetical protein
VSAVDLARDALLSDVGADAVGEHLGCEPDAERVVTHYFAARQAGYRGWRWAVTVARAARAKAVTVDEIVLLPGEEAVIAPDWVPWNERVTAQDLHPGDLLPAAPDDVRLSPGYTGADEHVDSPSDEPQDEPADDDVAWVVRELGLGRVRVLSPEGRRDAADRWYEGEGGPDTPMAQAAPGRCATCGFLVLLRGPLAGMFGLCANVQAPRDGQVVALDHGCGAHSEGAAALIGPVRPRREGPSSALDTTAWDV